MKFIYIILFLFVFFSVNFTPDIFAKSSDKNISNTNGSIDFQNSNFSNILTNLFSKDHGMINITKSGNITELGNILNNITASDRITYGAKITPEQWLQN
jgi:hypothetical protein